MPGSNSLTNGQRRRLTAMMWATYDSLIDQGFQLPPFNDWWHDVIIRLFPHAAGLTNLTHADFVFLYNHFALLGGGRTIKAVACSPIDDALRRLRAALGRCGLPLSFLAGLVRVKFFWHGVDGRNVISILRRHAQVHQINTLTAEIESRQAFPVTIASTLSNL